MEVASTAISILTISLSKRLGKEALAAVFSDEKSVTRGFLEGALSDGGGKLADSLKRVLDGLTMTRKVRREIEDNPTIFDLAGIAWSQALAARNDDDLGGIARPPGDIKRVLSPRWFLQTLMGLSGPEPGLGFEAGAINPREKPSEALLEQIAQQASLAALDEFGIPGAPDALMLSLIRNLVAELPVRIEALFLALPGASDVLALVAAEAARDEAQLSRKAAEATQRVVGQIAGHFDGTVIERQASRAMRLFAAKTVALLDRDVFGRSSASADEFALLPLGDTYVEPKCKSRQGDEQPVLEHIKTQLLTASHGLVALLAPFGFGKSLTVRMLAARLAREWLNDPTNAPLPIFVQAPEILSSHARNLEEATRNHLELRMDLDPGVVSWIWHNVKLIVLLDSFDEVVLDRREARNWITILQQFTKAGRHRVLVASRDHALELKWLEATDRTFHIQGFSPEQIGTWLERTKDKVHDGSLTAEQVINWLGEDLAGTPILLLMAAWDWTSAEANRAMKKSELYSRFVERISRGKWKGIQEAHKAVEEGATILDDLHDGDAYQKALARIAWAHLVNESRRGESDSPYVLPLTEVEMILRREFRTRNGTELDDEEILVIQKSIVLSVFLRRAEDNEGLRFAHKSFREYLCAKHIVTCLQEPHIPPCLHPGIVALSQIELPSEELTFAADLLRSSCEPAKRTSLEILDNLIQNQKCVLRIGPGHAHLHSEVHGDQLIEIGPKLLSQTQNGFKNAENLALLIRNRHAVRRLAHRLSHTPATIDGDYRILRDGPDIKVAYRRHEDEDRFWAIISKDRVDQTERLPGHITRPDGTVAIPLPLHAVPLPFSDNITFSYSARHEFLLELGRHLDSRLTEGRSTVGNNLFAWMDGSNLVAWPIFQLPENTRRGHSTHNAWSSAVHRWMFHNWHRLQKLDIFSDPIATKVLLVLTFGDHGQTFKELLTGFVHIVENYIILQRSRNDDDDPEFE